MLSIQSFLEQAPKVLLNRLYKRSGPGGGLVKNSRIISDVTNWATNSKRLSTHLAQLDSVEQKILAAIYSSGSRGLEISKLPMLLGEERRHHATSLVEELCWELLAWRSTGSPTIHGFSDLRSDVAALTRVEWLFSDPDASLGEWHDYSHFLFSHLSVFLASIRLLKPKFTQSGELHRRFLAQTAESLVHARGVSESLPDEECSFLLNMSVRLGLLGQKDGNLNVLPLADELLSLPAEESWQKLVDVWQTERLPDNGEVLRSNLEPLLEGALHLADASELWWFFENSRRKDYSSCRDGFTWEELPLLLREVWLLGLVRFSMKKGRLQEVALTAQGLCLLSLDKKDLAVAFPKGGVAALPDMEVMVPCSLSGNIHHVAALAGTRTGDGPVARYRLSRSSVLAGLQAGLDPSVLRDFCKSAKMTTSALCSLEGWISSYTGSEIRHALVLKVGSAEKIEELSALPEFMDLCEEEISGYGFLLKPAREEKARELLSSFGLEPSGETRCNKDSELALIEIRQLPAGWTLSPLSEREVDFRLPEPRPRPKEKGPELDSKYGGRLRKQGFNQVLQLIRYSILTDGRLEMTTLMKEGKEPRIYRALELNQKTDPFTFQALREDTGDELQFEVEKINEIRVVD